MRPGVQEDNLLEFIPVTHLNAGSDAASAGIPSALAVRLLCVYWVENDGTSLNQFNLRSSHRSLNPTQYEAQKLHPPSCSCVERPAALNQSGV